MLNTKSFHDYKKQWPLTTALLDEFIDDYKIELFTDIEEADLTKLCSAIMKDNKNDIDLLTENLVDMLADFVKAPDEYQCKYQLHDYLLRSVKKDYEQEINQLIGIIKSRNDDILSESKALFDNRINEALDYQDCMRAMPIYL